MADGFGVAGPAVGTSAQGGIGCHVRSGKHEVTDFDWQQHLDFADPNHIPGHGHQLMSDEWIRVAAGS